MSKTSSKEPKWLRNYWRIFDGIRQRADFEQEVQELRELRISKQKDALPLVVDKGFQLIITKHQIPPTCISALECLVNNPSAPDDVLKSKIISPISWVHPSTRQLGPIHAEYMDYEMWRHLRGGYYGLSLLLEIRPYTKVDEIKDFLDEYKDEIDKILKNPPIEAKFDYPDYLSKRVDKPDTIGEIGLKLREEGHTTKDILRILDIEDSMDESNMRAYIARAKGRRNARNKRY